MTTYRPHRLELIWPGKQPLASDPGGHRATPPALQVAARHGGDDGVDSAGQPWRNQLVLGDNLDVMTALLPRHGGQVRLIYVDPPFATGSDFRTSAGQDGALGGTGADGSGVPGRTVGEPRVGGQDASETETGSPTVDAATAPDETLAFSDRWADGGAEYLQFLYLRLPLLKELLAPTGTLWVHCDPRMDWAIRCLLDEVFGHRSLINQIVWHYTGGGRSRRYFSRKHDLLFWVANGNRWTFNIDAVRQPYRATSGYARAGIRARSGKYYRPHPAGTPADDVWDIPILNPMAKERLGYPTQKPERLLERILLAASSPDDLVADLFCGSGTTLAVAERVGRRWIGCDQSPAAVEVTRRRIQAIAGYRPFEVLHSVGTGGDQTADATDSAPPP